MTGGLIHKPMYERLILCEFAVADLTTANANVFYYDYSDIQVNLLTVNNGILTTALTNGAAGEVKGAELEIEAQATEFLHLRAALSHLDTEYTDFKNVNPNTGVVTADYSGNRFVRSPEQVISL
eukprot:gene49371-60437_t